MSELAQEHTTARAHYWPHLGFRRFSAVEMLIALVLLFVATPFIEGMPYGELVETLLTSLFFISAVLAIGGRHRLLLTTIALAIPAVVCKWTNHFYRHTLSPVPYLIFAVVFLVFVIVNILRFVLRTPRVNAEVLCASISVYLMIGIIWAMGYRLVATLNPAAFNYSPPTGVNSMAGYSSFYFSFVTLSTLGFGDITPASPISRMLVIMESMTGTLYVAVLIARLVALYSSPMANRSSEHSQPN